MKCSRDYRLAYTDKAKAIISSMTLEEKVNLMGGEWSIERLMQDLNGNPEHHYNYAPYPAGGNIEKGVPPMLFVDGPRGVVCGTGKSTCFPVSMLRGATFDIDLEERIGRAIGEETRAFKGNTYAGVCINLPYNPGWGRSQETYGEDSFHLGQMGSALVRGVQDKNVVACIKHFAFNQMEISRFKVSVDCDKRTEREVLLPHFKDCIDAGAGSVMSSYNLYKGTHCGHHNYLLNQVLKEEWNFDGFVMSDFIWGVKNTVEAANGGQNIEMCCTKYFGDKLVEAVKAGDVSEDVIDDAALRIIRTLLAFTEADSRNSDDSCIGNKEHISLALEAARKGITLLQNKGHLLPLNKEKTIRIAVLGQLADKEVIGDHGSSQVHPKYVISPLQGLANISPSTEVVFYGGQNIEHAKELAKDADAVVFVVGYNHDDEGEFVSADQNTAYTGAVGGDRVKSLGLKKDEIELIKTVGPVNNNSIAVLVGGNMIMMTDWKDCVSAIIMSYYAGMEGGTAIAEILFGDVNPSGKLPYVIPYNETDLPQVDWDTDYQWYDYYHGYAKLEKEGIEPLLPYGFGLSYTTFSVSDAIFSTDNVQISASCMVKNTGSVHGAEVIQMYIGFKNSSIDRPIKQLRGFLRVELEPGDSRNISISCPVEKIKWYNPLTNNWELEHMDYEVYIGTSCANQDLLTGRISL